jgi:predicted RNA methylase
MSACSTSPTTCRSGIGDVAPRRTLNDRGGRKVADIACGTGILAARIVSELHPDEVYGVDMCDGMLAQARMRSSQVLFEGAGIDVSDQHRVHRPAWARVPLDLITVGIKP